jgi:hypothetical protein
MLNLPKTSIIKLLAKPTKEKRKERAREKKVAIYWKIVSPEAFVDRKDGRFHFLKECMQPDYRY